LGRIGRVSGSRVYECLVCVELSNNALAGSEWESTSIS